MARVVFEKATKRQARLRMAIDGPSGSGKTYTALIFATALRKALGPEAGRIAFIDTEHGSASKYADLFDFDVLTLDNFHPQNYIDGIKAAEQLGYSVLIIDSLSHAWEGEGGVLELHDAELRRSGSGNSWTAWRNVTPLHRKLVEAILQARCHVIATMRSKMEYIQTQDDKGRTIIKKVGMAPVQRQGMEYEFDIVADLDIDHTMVISKTRCPAIADVVVNRPDAKWFQTLIHWLSEGTSEDGRLAEAPQGQVVQEGATIALEMPQSEASAQLQPAAAETARADTRPTAGRAPSRTHEADGSTGPKRWTQERQTTERFSEYAQERYGMSDAEVLAALEVEKLEDFQGSKKEALERLEAAERRRAEGAQASKSAEQDAMPLPTS